MFDCFNIAQKDLLSDYNAAFVKAWQKTQSYFNWVDTCSIDKLKEHGVFIPGHPYHGMHALSGFTAKLSDFSRSLTQSSKDSETSSKPDLSAHQKPSAIFYGMSNWYSNQFKKARIMKIRL